MRINKRATTSIKRQPLKYGLLFILVLILTSVSALSLSVRNAMDVMEEQIMSQVPAVSKLSLNFDEAAAYLGVASWDPIVQLENPQPSIEIMTQIGNSQYVNHFDFYLIFSLLSPSLTWVTPAIDDEQIAGVSSADILAVISGTNFWSDSATAESFPVKGVEGEYFIDELAGITRIIYGNYFLAEQLANGDSVTIISEELARINSLEIGDIIDLHSAVHDTIVMAESGLYNLTEGWLEEEFMLHHEIISLEIIGIFEVTFDINYDNFQGFEFFQVMHNYTNLHNQFYVPINLLDNIMRNEFEANIYLHNRILEAGGPNEGFSDDAEPVMNGIFLLNHPRYLANFREEANNYLPDFWEMVDASNSFLSLQAGMESVLDLANIVIYITIAASIVVIVLVLLLILKDRKKEVGTYLALGDKKALILSQILLEIMLVSTVAILCSLAIVMLISSELTSSLVMNTLLDASGPSVAIPWELGIFNPGNFQVESAMEAFDTTLNTQTSLMFVILSLLTVLLSTSVSFAILFRNNTKQILQNAT